MKYSKNKEYDNIDIEKLRETEEGVNEIINHYQNMIYKLVKGYVVSGYTKEDLISECNMILLEKIKLYDKSLSDSFSTYLYPCLQGRLNNMQRDQYRKKQKAMSTCQYWDAISDEDDHEYPLPSNEDVDQMIEDKMMYDWYLEQAKGMLSDDNYKIFRDCTIIPQCDVCKKYGKRQSTVNSVWIRTIKKLKLL